MDDPDSGAETSALVADLSEAQRAELERRRYVRIGDELVWIEPEGTIRREKTARLYYVRTNRGVFRISRISGQVIEV